jgi:predicted nuclease of predicted toxin-antitoxin system
LTAKPPPKVIHLRIGNLRIGQLHDFLNKVWPEVLSLVKTCKLVTVYLDRIEGVEENSDSS